MIMLRTIYLLAAGVLAIGLGGAILLAPVGFYAGYGLDLAGQVTLLNELRAPGLCLVLAGGFMAAGALRSRWAQPALVTAAALYSAYGVARLVGFALDGMPQAGLVLAAAVEIALGLAGLALLRAPRRATA